MPTFPGEEALRVERSAFVATAEALDPQDFESGPTLCAGWAPRDVLAHLLGIDDGPRDYLRPDLLIRWLTPGNERQVERYRTAPREELLDRARRWATQPAGHARAAAVFLLGDVAVHHQDVLRPHGIGYDPPRASVAAVYREGAVLSGTRLLRNRVVPTDGVGRPVGVGPAVRGPALELGLWLSGRAGVESGLTFG